jgi:hypothetical protein
MGENILVFGGADFFLTLLGKCSCYAFRPLCLEFIFQIASHAFAQGWPWTSF